MPDIEDIITATKQAYRVFAASETDRDLRVSVGNAVRFLVADLTSAAHLAATTKGN